MIWSVEPRGFKSDQVDVAVAAAGNFAASQGRQARVNFVWSGGDRFIFNG